MPDAHQGPESSATALLTIGQALMAARTNKGLTAEQLANHLHIGVEQLLALENGNTSELPEPVFIRAMVRRIASHLHIDPDPLVAQLQSTVTVPSPTPAVVPPPRPTRTNRRPSLLWLMPLVLLIGGGAVLAINRMQQPTTATVETVPTQSASDQRPPAVSQRAASVQISSVQRTWIELQRNGETEFMGWLEGSRLIDDPEGVKIYAGRPDLIVVSRGEQAPAALGPITPLRWYSLSPEP